MAFREAKNHVKNEFRNATESGPYSTNKTIHMQHTETNRRKTAQLERLLRELLAKSLRRGFYGTASLEFVVSDGTIQGIRERLEQTHK